MTSGNGDAGCGQDVIGIDLGTTNSVVSCLREGRPEAIFADGHCVVPSVVYLDEQGAFRVGREARNLELSAPERTIRSVKRKMGQEHRFEIAGQSLSPEEVSAQISSPSSSARKRRWVGRRATRSSPCPHTSMMASGRPPCGRASWPASTCCAC